MTEQPWIFVSTTTVSEPGWIWCREQIDLQNWDYTRAGFWFKHEQDAIMFSLKWL